MTDADLVAALRLALAQAGDTWRNQPSVLRRRLEGVLGADAASQRAKVHLLTVAAEERVPDRIARSDHSSAQLVSIADDLAATRGWTTVAAGWSVTTWCAALAPAEGPTAGVVAPTGATSRPDPPAPVGSSTEDPETSDPETSDPDPAAPRVPSAPDETVLPAVPPAPPSARPAPPTSLPPPPPPSPPAPPSAALPPPPPRSGSAAAGVTPAPSPSAPNRRQRKLSETVSDYLDQPVDQALEGYRGNPNVIAVVIAGLMIGGIVTIAGIFAGSTPIAAVGGVVITASAVGLPLARKAASICWVAVQGDVVQVIETVRNANNSAVPTGVSFVGTRSDVAVVPGASSAVQVGGEKITFVRSRARAMAILGGDRP